MYEALDIARYIVDICAEKKHAISNLKIQKILYFIQAEFLVERKKACFTDKIEAWDFGPVIPEVYRYYKAYGGGNIPRENITAQIKIKEVDKQLIDMVVEACNDYSAVQLVNITHKQKPWIQAYKKHQNNEITNNSIQKFFEG